MSETDLVKQRETKISYLKILFSEGTNDSLFLWGVFQFIFSKFFVRDHNVTVNLFNCETLAIIRWLNVIWQLKLILNQKPIINITIKIVPHIYTNMK